MKLIIYLSLLLFSLEATPYQVMVIRHGEKVQNGILLSLKGEQRAQALAPFFACQEEFIPHFLIAQKPNERDPSLRSIFTLSPTSNFLNLYLNKEYGLQHWEEMADEILTNPLYEGKRVLICWSHHMIPCITRKLGVKDAPRHWDGKVFDRLWVITYKEGGVAFENLPQRLMFGDSDY